MSDQVHGAVAQEKWLAVDLDGTLAEYDGWKGDDHIGWLIPEIADAIVERYEQGWKIAIFTARVSGTDDEASRAIKTIHEWLQNNRLSQYVSQITALKHKQFTEFWDDRAVQVIKNTGKFVNAKSAGGAVASSLDVQVGGSHYKDMVIQPAEYCEYNQLPALESAVIKYISRHGKKNGVQDLEKAIDLIQMIIELRYSDAGINHLIKRLEDCRTKVKGGK